MSVAPHTRDLPVSQVSKVVHPQLVGEVTTIHRVDVPAEGMVCVGGGTWSNCTRIIPTMIYAPVVVSEVSLPLCLLPLTIILTNVVTFELFKVRVHLVAAMLLLVSTCPHKLKHWVLGHRKHHTTRRLAGELCQQRTRTINSHYMYIIIYLKKLNIQGVPKLRFKATVFHRSFYREFRKLKH